MNDLIQKSLLQLGLKVPYRLGSRLNIILPSSAERIQMSSGNHDLQYSPWYFLNGDNNYLMNIKRTITTTTNPFILTDNQNKSHNGTARTPEGM